VTPVAPAATPPAGAAAGPGSIQARALDELWLHTGTACNLDCHFCLEGSKPGDDRLGRLTLADIRPLLDEAVGLGVRRFAFTGGEPFVVKDMVSMLEYAAGLRPCLVLTNGTAPVVRRLAQIRRLAGTPYPVSFRVSLDHPDEARHDAGRGAGNFRLALQALRALRKAGFAVSVTRQMLPHEDGAAVAAAFRELFAAEGLPTGLQVVPLPEFGLPGEHREVPAHPAAALVRDGANPMCGFSRMAAKVNGRLRIYACPLVDDDPRFDQGDSLVAALRTPVTPNHHRCYSCLRYGASCSGLE
jgi:sulfatase maturation enzyme AslB (radical SAM superfamily)